MIYLPPARAGPFSGADKAAGRSRLITVNRRMQIIVVSICGILQIIKERWCL
jgi:hypothetical protein